MKEELLRQLRNTRVKYVKPIITPNELRKLIPASDKMGENVLASRRTIENILSGKDNRKLVFVGPCSIHDVRAAIEYAEKLKSLASHINDKIYTVMRVYPEKPRSVLGWEGLIPDPDVCGNANYSKGLELTRKLLCDIASMDIPITLEILGDRSIQYYDELISHGSLGARTVESMPQRKVMSFLSIPVGIKNNTEGNIDVAVDAIETIVHGHESVGMDDDVKLIEVGGYGNPYSHLILRGGNGKPNYHPEKVQYAIGKLKERNLPINVVVDCSHANSGKKYTMQPDVFNAVLEQMATTPRLVGWMLESNHNEGKQTLPENLNSYTKQTLDPYLSITDACISFKTTEKLLHEAYDKLKSL